MLDHLKEARKIQVEIYRKMTAGQKVAQSMTLYWTAWKLKASAIKQDHPQWTQDQIDAEVRKIFAKLK